MLQDQVEPSQCQGNEGEHTRAKWIARQKLLTPPLRMGRDESKDSRKKQPVSERK